MSKLTIKGKCERCYKLIKDDKNNGSAYNITTNETAEDDKTSESINESTNDKINDYKTNDSNSFCFS